MSAHLSALARDDLDYAALTQRSRVALEQAKHRLTGGHTRQTLIYPPHPFFARRGRGAQIEDIDGRSYLDFVNNYTSLIHGHAHAATDAAIVRQLQDGPALGAPSTLELEMAAEVSQRIPSLERLRFAVTGSEAVGFALRVARAVTERPRVLKFEGGFQGSWDEVQQSIRSEPLAPGAFSGPVPNSEGLARVDTIVARYNDADSVRAALDRHGSEIGSIIIEPFLGNNALIPVDPPFLRWLEATSRDHGALLILDEVQSCRLALGAAQSLYGMRPDLTVIGKTIGGGFPLAAFGGREEVMAVMDGMDPDVPQPGTFNAFPVSLAAGLATLDAWREPQIAALNELGAEVRARITDTFAARGVPASVTGEGSMFHIALRDERITDYADIHDVDSAGWQLIHQQLLARGVYVASRGTGCLSTPMTRADIDFFIARLDEAVGVLAARRACAP